MFGASHTPSCGLSSPVLVIAGLRPAARVSPSGHLRPIDTWLLVNTMRAPHRDERSLNWSPDVGTPRFVNLCCGPRTIGMAGAMIGHPTWAEVSALLPALRDDARTRLQGDPDWSSDQLPGGLNVGVFAAAASRSSAVSSGVNEMLTAPEALTISENDVALASSGKSQMPYTSVSPNA